MKTGEVQDPGNGAAAYLETDGWTPWLYHAHEEEVDRCHSAANAMMMKVERMPPAVRARLDRIEIRCPVKGCLLATVYWIPRRPTAEEIEHHQRLYDIPPPSGTGPQMHSLFRQARDALYVGRTSAGTEVYDILTYGFPHTWKDEVRGCSCCRVVYWRAGCRHGTAGRGVRRGTRVGSRTVRPRVRGHGCRRARQQHGTAGGEQYPPRHHRTSPPLAAPHPLAPLRHDPCT